jgi:hypothetical protein
MSAAIAGMAASTRAANAPAILVMGRTPLRAATQSTAVVDNYRTNDSPCAAAALAAPTKPGFMLNEV